MTTNDNNDTGNDNNNHSGNPLPLEASREDLLHCQLSSWFPTFSQLPPDHEYRRSNVTIKSQIIAPLPPHFTDFLLEDGIRLPQGATKLSSCAPYEAWQQNDDDSDHDDQNDDKDNNESDQQQQRQFSFPQLNQQLQEAIAALGGSVMPKLNWSAPKDATWVNEGTLKCKTPGDVYLLLKSSDFCLHDWQVFQERISRKAQSQFFLSGNDNMDENAAKEQQQQPQQEEPRLELVLRKWCNFYPSMEFRCFVRNHILIGISQRNHSQHYPHLLHDKERIQSLILEFFEDVVCHRFANNKLANYVFDVYIDRSDRVWLVDFNVWSIQTDALLYTWEELVDLRVPVDVYDNHDDDFPAVRVVETALEVRQDPLSSYRAPMDTVTLASSSNAVGCGGGGSGGPTSFESFMAMCQKPSERTDCEESSTGSDEGDGGGGQQQEQTRG